jgi:hypothetical protein
MAEKKDKPQGGAEDGVKSPAAHAKREAKQSRWTMDLCMKYAKRFDSVEAWAAGMPSSYKAAVARGFMDKCTAHMSGKTMTKATKAPVKTVAKGKTTKKPPTRMPKSA